MSWSEICSEFSYLLEQASRQAFFFLNQRSKQLVLKHQLNWKKAAEASTTKTGSLSSFSCYGKESVDVAAPGHLGENSGAMVWSWYYIHQICYLRCSISFWMIPFFALSSNNVSDACHDLFVLKTIWNDYYEWFLKDLIFSLSLNSLLPFIWFILVH